MGANQAVGKATEARVVFHADDFGETVEITRGIVDAIRGGVIRSSTILANMPGTEFAIERARELLDEASFGVHVNLCEGASLTGLSSMTDGHGMFLSKRALAVRAFTGRLEPAHVVREIEAQVGFVHSSGIPVSHVDGHKHLHMLPVVRDAVARTARAFDIERVRVTAHRSWRAMASVSDVVREGIARGARRRFRAARLRFPNRALDLAQALAWPVSELARYLAGSGGLTEVVCHPGTARGEVEKPGSCERSRQLDYLCHPELTGALEDAGVALVSYWEV